MKKPKWKIVKLPVTELHPHPANTIHSQRSPAEDESLDEDMRSNGQQHPIDILPNKVIVVGQRRWQSAKRLGWEKIRCRIRFDLAAAGDEAIEKYLLLDNLHRRQLHPLEQARVFRRLKQLEGRRPGQVRGDLRDILAKQFGVSGRTLDRWTCVLETPQAVQDAVVAGTLKLVPATQVAGLTPDAQAQIAERIEKGESPESVVASYLNNGKPVQENIGTLLGRLLRDLNKHRNALDGRIREVASPLWAKHVPTVKRARKFLRQLQEHLEKIGGSGGDPKLIEHLKKRRSLRQHDAE